MREIPFNTLLVLWPIRWQLSKFIHTFFDSCEFLNKKLNPKNKFVGFASSLLISNEKHHTENNHLRKSRRDYDSDINSRDEFYRNSRNKYIPRERSIDDGSHYDPRLDKDVERTIVKGTEKKPPKPEKRSGLDKVR